MTILIYPYHHLILGVCLKLRTKIAAALGVSAMALPLTAEGVAAESAIPGLDSIPGLDTLPGLDSLPGLDELQAYFDPDIEGLRALLMEAVETIMADPNIYAAFDYNAMLEFVQASTVATYLIMLIGGIYLFATVLVVFRSRRKDPGRR